MITVSGILKAEQKASQHMWILRENLESPAQILRLHRFCMTALHRMKPAFFITDIRNPLRKDGRIRPGFLYRAAGGITPFICQYRQVIARVQSLNNIVPALHCFSLPRTKILIVADIAEFMARRIDQIRHLQSILMIPRKIDTAFRIRIFPDNSLRAGPCCSRGHLHAVTAGKCGNINFVHALPQISCNALQVPADKSAGIRHIPVVFRSSLFSHKIGPGIPVPGFSVRFRIIVAAHSRRGRHDLNAGFMRPYHLLPVFEIGLAERSEHPVLPGKTDPHPDPGKSQIQNLLISVLHIISIYNPQYFFHSSVPFLLKS